MRRPGPGGRYPYRPTQSDPSVIIPEAIYARIVIAAEERGISPGMWVELVLRQGLKAHGVGMDDAAYDAACRRAEANMSSAPMRHEFERTRGRRMTDPL